MRRCVYDLAAVVAVGHYNKVPSQHLCELPKFTVYLVTPFLFDNQNLLDLNKGQPKADTSSNQSKGKEAMVAIKSDVRTLQQLSSSGAAAKKKREENQVDRGMQAIEGAIQAHLQQDQDNNQGSS